jgi:hypothetical protein
MACGPQRQKQQAEAKTKSNSDQDDSKAGKSRQQKHIIEKVKQVIVLFPPLKYH